MLKSNYLVDFCKNLCYYYHSDWRQSILHDFVVNKHKNLPILDLQILYFTNEFSLKPNKPEV